MSNNCAPILQPIKNRIRAIFDSLSKVIGNCVSSALHRRVIGPENTRRTQRYPYFSRGSSSLVIFILSPYWYLSFFSGQISFCDYFGFDLTTLGPVVKCSLI